MRRRAGIVMCVGVLALLLPVRPAAADLITTAAGTGAAGYSGDGGPATNATIERPRGIALLPTGGFAFVESEAGSIRRVSPGGTITTVIGQVGPDVGGCAVFGGYVDASGATARFRCPQDFVVSPKVGADGSFVAFLADTENHLIRRISVSAQDVWTASTLAGTPGTPGHADGLPGVGTLSNPAALAIEPDGSHVFAATGNRVVRIDATTGDIVTIAGAGATAAYLDHPIGTSARFSSPTGLTADGTTVWVSDSGNHRIRAVSLSPPFSVSTIIGSGASGVGNWTDGTATAAVLDNPRGIVKTTDASLLWVEAGSCTARKAPLATLVVTKVAGTQYTCSTFDGDPGQMVSPRYVSATTSASYLIADTNGQTIRRVGNPVLDPDGDGVTGAADACITVAAATANGCPSRATTISLRYSAGAFKGTVSSAAGCRGGRSVRIRKVVAGPDPLIGRATTRSTGAFSVTRPRRPGRYYAETSATFDPAVGTCRAGRSPTLTLT